MDKAQLIRCNECGSLEIEINNHSRIGKCKSCGALILLPIIDDYNIVALLDEAFIERNNFEFDKAISTYQYILSKVPNELCAYEGLILCKYGIVFVLDEKSNKIIPTCHRYNPISIYEDDDFISYVELCQSDDEKKVFYELANKINIIQKDIANQIKNEKPFDVFISYKSKNQNNTSTEDAMIAMELYDELVKNKFKVFMSDVTLKKRISEEYEPIIYSALYSSKIFILVATSKENVNSPWVKNEWSRFIDRIKNPIEEVDKNSFICVYKSMNPNDMPRILNRQIQSVDATDLLFKRQILEYIKKTINPTDEEDEYKKWLKYDKKVRKEIETAKRKQKFAEEKAKRLKALANKEKTNRIKAEKIANDRYLRDVELQKKKQERKLKKLELKKERKANKALYKSKLLCKFAVLSSWILCVATTVVFALGLIESQIVSYCIAGTIILYTHLIIILPLRSYENLCVSLKKFYKQLKKKYLIGSLYLPMYSVTNLLFIKNHDDYIILIYVIYIFCWVIAYLAFWLAYRDKK